MIKQILGTTFSRILILMGSVAILFLNTNYLGTKKLGELSLLLIALHFVLQVSELVGGPALVYLQKQYKSNKLLSISYIWSIVVSILSFFVIHIFVGNFNLVFIITFSAFIQSLNHTHLHLLVGKQKIRNYNLATVFQIVLVVVLISFFYVFKKSASVETYLLIYLIGQLLSLFLTFYFLRKTIANGGEFGFSKRLIIDVYRYGFIIQLANIFQFGVYRINYIILKLFTSLSTLGIYTLGNQLSEKALIPSKAISMVQYSKIANSEEKQKATLLTIQLLTLSVLLGLVASFALILIPESLISLLFGADFLTTKTLFIYLAPGIIFMSISTIYSHYFAGLGNYKFNTITSFIGMVSIIVLSFLLIPKYEMIGAAIATSVVYFIQVVIQIFIFKKESNLTWPQLLFAHKKSLKRINWNSIKKIIH